MDLNDFDYHLPENLIAQHPRPERGQSRLLVLHRDTSAIEHRVFKDLSQYMQNGDCLVVNETKVLPARLLGSREGTGGKVELLLVRDLGHGRWQFLIKPARRARVGRRLIFGDGRLNCELQERIGPGEWVGQFISPGDLEKDLGELGQVPLPPYIRRQPEPEDSERYQTVYARQRGAVAAPTAGLHFTHKFLDQLSGQGIVVVPILLHVGPGTFRPVQEIDIRQHHMEAEYFIITTQAAEAINRIKNDGGRVFAVGTTAVRALESCIMEEMEGAEGYGNVRAAEGWTDLFIYPPYRFRGVDALITNFHLPKSTLLMLVSAFSGREQILRAYREAVAEEYLFYSYGDAMLIL
jgi:S-adenosylmethionine:tRNA ribosyltransferase-isomerase